MELILAILFLLVGIKLVVRPMPSFGIKVAEKVVSDVVDCSEFSIISKNRYSTSEITIFLLRECSTTSIRGLAHDFYVTRKDIEEVLDKMEIAYVRDPTFTTLFEHIKMEFRKETGGQYRVRKF